ncbi:MAG: phosphatase PAP2 family protein [Clostridiales bacterium]|nr:phosphatase PAP2 family protein [Clostridiales bacterium]
MRRGRLTLICILPCAFCLLAVLVFTGAFLPVEQSVYSITAELISPGMTLVMRAVTELGSALPVILLCLLLLLIRKIRWRAGIPAVACVCASVICNQVLKYIFHRPRPTVLRLAPADGFSFPSGHSMNNAALYIALALLLVPLLSRLWQRILAFSGFMLPPFWVGVSRIYLGVHYFGDVLCGWLLGCWFALIAAALWKRYGAVLCDRLRKGGKRGG